MHVIGFGLGGGTLRNSASALDDGSPRSGMKFTFGYIEMARHCKYASSLVYENAGLNNRTLHVSISSGVCKFT